MSIELMSTWSFDIFALPCFALTHLCFALTLALTPRPAALPTVPQSQHAWGGLYKSLSRAEMNGEIMFLCIVHYSTNNLHRITVDAYSEQSFTGVSIIIDYGLYHFYISANDKIINLEIMTSSGSLPFTEYIMLFLPHPEPDNLLVR